METTEVDRGKQIETTEVDRWRQQRQIEANRLRQQRQIDGDNRGKQIETTEVDRQRQQRLKQRHKKGRDIPRDRNSRNVAPKRGKRGIEQLKWIDKFFIFFEERPSSFLP